MLGSPANAIAQETAKMTEEAQAADTAAAPAGSETGSNIPAPQAPAKESAAQELARMAVEGNTLNQDLAQREAAAKEQAADPEGVKARELADATKMPENTLATVGAEKWQGAGKGAPEKYESFKVRAEFSDTGEEVDAPKPGDNSTYDLISQYAREKNLDQDQAQELIDFSSRVIQENKNRDDIATATNTKAWREELQAAGLAGPEHARYANAALQQIDPQGRLRGIMDEWGFYAMPEVINGLSQLGRMISEGSALSGQPQPNADGTVPSPTARRSTKSLARDLVDIGLGAK